MVLFYNKLSKMQISHASYKVQSRVHCVAYDRHVRILAMHVSLLKVASYGGMLSFELQYTLLSDDARSYFDADVELIVSIFSLFHIYIQICLPGH